MLRASSLGLGHFPSTVYTLRTCLALRPQRIVHHVNTYATHSTSYLSNPSPDPARQKYALDDASPNHVAPHIPDPLSLSRLQEEVGQTTCEIGQFSEDNALPDQISFQKSGATPVAAIGPYHNMKMISTESSLAQPAAMDQDLLTETLYQDPPPAENRQSPKDTGRSKWSSNRDKLHTPHQENQVPPLEIRQSFLDDLAERMPSYQATMKPKGDFRLNEDVAKSLDHVTLRMKLLYDLAQTPSATHGWEAYTTLLKLESEGHYDPPIHFAHLHRLSRLISRARPKTRALFRQLLEVLLVVHKRGGRIHVSQWNALIYSAGRGLRKTTMEDFERSLSIYHDMIRGRSPGSGILKIFSSIDFDEDGKDHIVKPDIYTYTTLITIASRTLNPEALQHAHTLLERSGLQANRITYLSLLKYYSKNKMLEGVRSVLLKLNEHGYDIGIDGLNACIWAYGQNGKVETVKAIYRLLWHSVSPREHDEDIHSLARELKDQEYITVPSDYVPNEVTFTTVIQILAYHGDFLGTVRAFSDMLLTEKGEGNATLSPNEDKELEPEHFSPNIAIYRAIFLGFTRHAVSPTTTGNVDTESINERTWTLENLETIFGTFLEWESNFKITASVIYWIMLSFDKTSGRDIALLRKVWLQLEEKFHSPLGGRDDRLSRMRRALFPLEKYGLPGPT